jgi:hypothetical protein
MPVNALSTNRLEKTIPKPIPMISSRSQPSDASLGKDKGETEQEKLAAMFAASEEQWQQQQQEMAK